MDNCKAWQLSIYKMHNVKHTYGYNTQRTEPAELQSAQGLSVPQQDAPRRCSFDFQDETPAQTSPGGCCAITLHHQQGCEQQFAFQHSCRYLVWLSCLLQL